MAQLATSGRGQRLEIVFAHQHGRAATMARDADDLVLASGPSGEPSRPG